MPNHVLARATTGYQVNLSNHTPHVYVVLMPGTEADEPEFYPHLLTACPYESRVNSIRYAHGCKDEAARIREAASDDVQRYALEMHRRLVARDWPTRAAMSAR